MDIRSLKPHELATLATAALTRLLMQRKIEWDRIQRLISKFELNLTEQMDAARIAIRCIMSDNTHAGQGEDAVMRVNEIARQFALVKDLRLLMEETLSALIGKIDKNHAYRIEHVVRYFLADYLAPHPRLQRFDSKAYFSRASMSVQESLILDDILHETRPRMTKDDVDPKLAELYDLCGIPLPQPVSIPECA